MDGRLSLWNIYQPMKSFSLSDLKFTIQHCPDRLKTLLTCKTKIRIGIQGINFTSLVSATIQQNQLFWVETFHFQDMHIGAERITVSLLRSEEEEPLFEFTGQLIFGQGFQTIQAQWENQRIQLCLILEQLTAESNETELTDKQVSGQSLAKEFIRQVERKVSEPATETCTESLTQKPAPPLPKRNQTQYSDSQNEEQLALATKFSQDKDRAKSIAKEYLRRLSCGVDMKVQSKKLEKAGESLVLVSSKLQRVSSKSPKQSQRHDLEMSQQISRAYSKQEQENSRRSPKSTLKSSIVRSSIRRDQMPLRSNFGDKIFENQSATTMQKSILCFSVPKGPRFRGSKYNGMEPSYYVDTCFSAKNKGTSFGFGNRKPYPDWMVRNMHQNPAPNVYTVTAAPLDPTCSKGFSFGIPYSYYQKVSLVGSESIQHRSPLTASQLPKLSKTPSSRTFREPSNPTEHYHFRSRIIR